MATGPFSFTSVPAVSSVEEAAGFPAPCRSIGSTENCEASRTQLAFRSGSDVWIGCNLTGVQTNHLIVHLCCCSMESSPPVRSGPLSAGLPDSMTVGESLFLFWADFWFCVLPNRF